MDSGDVDSGSADAAPDGNACLAWSGEALPPPATMLVLLQQCLSSRCWDYDAMGNVQLIGMECTLVGMAVDTKVTIDVGCATVTM